MEIDGWSKQYDELVKAAQVVAGLQESTDTTQRRMRLSEFCRKTTTLLAPNGFVTAVQSVLVQLKDVAVVIAHHSDGHIPSDDPCHIKVVVNDTQYRSLKAIQVAIESAVSNQPRSQGPW